VKFRLQIGYWRVGIRNLRERVDVAAMEGIRIKGERRRVRKRGRIGRSRDYAACRINIKGKYREVGLNVENTQLISD